MAGKVKGLKEFTNMLENLSVEVEAQVKVIVRQATLEALGKAKQNAPVDTGYLRNSIQAEFTNGGLTGIIKSNADYSIHLEYGTSKAPAQPFMYPAYYTTLDWFKAELNQVVRGGKT